MQTDIDLAKYITKILKESIEDDFPCSLLNIDFSLVKNEFPSLLSDYEEFDGVSHLYIDQFQVGDSGDHFSGTKYYIVEGKFTLVFSF